MGSKQRTKQIEKIWSLEPVRNRGAHFGVRFVIDSPGQAWRFTTSDMHIRLAKWYAKRYGYAGNKGGWISGPGLNVQGWRSFYEAMRPRIWDALNEGREG